MKKTKAIIKMSVTIGGETFEKERELTVPKLYKIEFNTTGAVLAAGFGEEVGQLLGEVIKPKHEEVQEVSGGDKES